MNKEKLTMNDVKETIKVYLSRSTYQYDLGGDEDIFDIGIVHSLFAMQLILFIEKEFGIEIDEDDLDFDKIRTLNSISKLVEQRLA